MKGHSRILFLFTVTVCIVGSALAQNKTRKLKPVFEDFKNALKININYVHDLSTKANFSIGDFAPVFLINTRKNYIHEIEFNRLKINQSEYKQYDSQGKIIGGNRNRQTEIGIRYQLERNLLRNESRFVPQMGLSLLALSTFTDNIPLVTNSYRRKTITVGGFLAVVPQLRYNCSKRLFVDFALPIEFIHFGFTGQSIENPAIPIRQQRNGGFEFDTYFFEELHLRVGAGFKI